jgi:hypothetical protein
MLVLLVMRVSLLSSLEVPSVHSVNWGPLVPSLVLVNVLLVQLVLTQAPLERPSVFPVLLVNINQPKVKRTALFAMQDRYLAFMGPKNVLLVPVVNLLTRVA